MRKRRLPGEASSKAEPEIVVQPPLEEGEVLVFGPSIPLVIEPVTLADRIKLARERSVPRLNKATDKLNEAVLRLTGVLADLRLGVPAEVAFENEDPSGRYSTTLAFRKHEGSWGLVIDSDDDFEGIRLSTTPLVKASREVRLQAVELLPRLVDALIARADTEAERVENGIETISSLAQQILEAKS